MAAAMVIKPSMARPNDIDHDKIGDVGDGLDPPDQLLFPDGLNR
jgi:hypothetical protein